MPSELYRLLEPQKTKWWGSTYEFQPALIEKIYGDGKLLMQLFPINERPRYWVVRVDSRHASGEADEDAFFDMLEDIYDKIDEQFGTPSEEDLGIGDERPYFPMFDSQGSVWHFVRTPEPPTAASRQE